MKREHRLRYIIKEGLLDTFYIWKDELRNVFKDAGVMIFFFLVPFVYPLLYSFIYNNEVVHEAKMVVVDQSDSYLSREFTRRVNATPDVEVVGVCPDMAEAKKMLDEKKAYGILLFPPDYSKDLHEGRQTTVSLYCDMSALLFYKAFLLAATEVSLDMGKELRMHNNPSSTDKMDQITVDPIPYESVALFNSQNGFASFLVPAILILVLQQTLILGIGMLGGTAREKNRFHSLVPICRHFNGTLLVFVFTSVILLFISGVSWPEAAIPPFWKVVGYLFPSTPGIQGFIRINTAGVSLHEVAHEYRVLWIQAGVYFILSCIIYRYQIIRSRKMIIKQYRYMKMRRMLRERE